MGCIPIAADLPIAPLNTAKVFVIDAQSTANTTHAVDPAAMAKSSIPNIKLNKLDTRLPPKIPQTDHTLLLPINTLVSSF